MKEYSSYKSPTKQLAHSIQKSLQCIPTGVAWGQRHGVEPGGREIFPIKPQRPLDLTNVVPMTPQTLRHHRQGVLSSSYDYGGGGGGMSAEWMQFLPGQYGLMGGPSTLNGGGAGSVTAEDEHKLIARYAAKLAGRTNVRRF